MPDKSSERIGPQSSAVDPMIIVPGNTRLRLSACTLIRQRHRLLCTAILRTSRSSRLSSDPGEPSRTIVFEFHVIAALRSSRFISEMAMRGQSSSAQPLQRNAPPPRLANTSKRRHLLRTASNHIRILAFSFVAEGLWHARLFSACLFGNNDQLMMTRRWPRTPVHVSDLSPQ